MHFEVSYYESFFGSISHCVKGTFLWLLRATVLAYCKINLRISSGSFTLICSMITEKGFIITFFFWVLEWLSFQFFFFFFKECFSAKCNNLDLVTFFCKYQGSLRMVFWCNSWKYCIEKILQNIIQQIAYVKKYFSHIWIVILGLLHMYNWKNM